MIVSPFHPGSGLGDQLFCYLAGRLAAKRLGVPHGMVGDFKGKGFMNLEYQAVPHAWHVEMPAGKIVVPDLPVYEGQKWYDPEFNFIQDDTLVDGCKCQDERYFEAYWDEINEWLKVEPLAMDSSTCLIGFRGGEYAAVPELYLSFEYWQKAVEAARAAGFSRFEVHTDDSARARGMLKDLLPAETSYIHDIELNWRAMRSANCAIIANSAFYILPRLLKHYEDMVTDNGATTWAPRYWARRNIKEWSTPQSYYKSFTYL